ncbi:MAG: branched-chain amino acid ABC transporter permease [Salinirussus sp.]
MSSQPRSDHDAEGSDASDASAMSVSVGSRRISARRISLIAGLGILLGFPAVFPNFIVGILLLALIFGIFAISIDLLWGYTGILTFGHAVFFGLGAYLMAKVLAEVGTSPSLLLAGVIVTVILTGLLGGLIAGILFNRGISEDYFAIITLALAIIAEQTAVSWSSVTNGANGFIVPTPRVGIPGVLTIEFSGLVLYYAVVLLIVGSYALSRRIVRSPFGTTLVAIRENETRASSLGYDVDAYRTAIFGISSAIAGFAGTLYPISEGFVSPPILGFIQSTNALIWVLVGGRGTLVGPIIGASTLNLFEELISGLFLRSWTLVLGLTLILIVLVFPGGIVGLFERLQERLAERVSSTAEESGEHEQ